MRSLPSCVNVYGFRVSILELSHSVKRKTMCLFIWTLEFITRYQTQHFWNTNSRPNLDSIYYFDTMIISHFTPVCGRCTLVRFFISSLIDPNTGKSLWHKHYSEINCSWFVNVKTHPRFSGPQTKISKSNCFSQSTMSLHMLFDSSWINSQVLHQHERLTPFKYEYVREDKEFNYPITPEAIT